MAATSAAAPVAAVTVDDLQRAVEEVKRTVRKAKREIIEDAHTARARGARQRQENVDSPRVPRGVAGRQRRLSVTRGALRLLPQPQGQFLSTRASPRDKTIPYCRLLELV